MFNKKQQSRENNNNNSNNNSDNNNNNVLHKEKKLDISLLVGQCLQDNHLIKKKINLIITEEKIVFKDYVQSYKNVQ